MISYRLTQDADADLSAILWQGLETFGVHQTERYLTSLEELFAQLSLFPQSGRLRSDIRPPVRILPYRAHVIVYEQTKTEVVILRIRSAREDWTTDPLGTDEP